MASTIDKLANYQIVADLLNTYLDYNIDQRKMYLNAESSAKERRIVKQNGINYYADDMTPVLPNVPGPPPASESKDNSMYQWTDTREQLNNPDFDDAKPEDPNEYMPNPNFDQNQDPSPSNPQYLQEKNVNYNPSFLPNDKFNQIVQGDRTESEDAHDLYGAVSTKVGVGSGSSATTRDMKQQGGIWYYVDDGEEVFPNVKSTATQNYKITFNQDTGEVVYIDKGDPKAEPIIKTVDNWTRPANDIKTQFITKDNTWILLNKDNGEQIATGNIGTGTNQTNHSMNKDRVTEHINNLTSLYKWGDAADEGTILNNLYNIINADEDVTDDEVTSYISMADDIKKEKRTTEKSVSKDAVSQSVKIINQGMLDKFGAGPSGNRTTIDLG